jgi:RNA polymerase-binding transcription factor DksA
MEKEKLDLYKGKLLEEKARLEAELSTVGRVNPDNPMDWEAISVDKGDDTSDPNDNADAIEDFENNAAILRELEIQLNDVNSALRKIEEGSFGKCEVGGELIDEGRLNANPSARTCTEHMKS